MFAKYSLVFVLCFVSLVLAGPHPHHEHEGHHKDDSQGHHQNGEGHQHKDHSGEKHHERSQGYKPYQVRLDSPFQKIKNLTSQWYTEFFVVATGDHFYSPEVSNDIHVAARAVVLLSQKLHAMPEVYGLLANTSVDFALNSAKPDEKDAITKFVNEVIAHVQKCPSLSAEYESIKSSLSDSFISHGKYFKPESQTSPEVKAKSIDQWVMDPFMRAAVLNKMFFAKSFRDDHHHSCKIAKSLLEQASDPEVHDKLEKIYSDSVAKTIEATCPAHDKEKAERLLFNHMMDLFAEDGALSVRLFGNKKFMLLNHSVLW